LGRVRAGELSRRVPRDETGDAFARLGHEVNQALDRVEALNAELKLATDGLAHDFKSPLTRLRSALDRIVRTVDSPQALDATVRQFNQGAQRGEDPEFGKGADAHSRFRGDQTHRPNPSIAPVGDGPYYAVAIHPGDLSTVGGLETNGRAQVLDAESQPIRGLYAAGLDMNSMMRGRYPGGGSSIGPAMTFGFVAVRAGLGRAARTSGSPYASRSQSVIGDSTSSRCRILMMFSWVTAVS